MNWFRWFGPCLIGGAMFAALLPSPDENIGAKIGLSLVFTVIALAFVVLMECPTQESGTGAIEEEPPRGDVTR